MRYYLRGGPGERIEGPYYLEQLQAMHAEGPFGEAVEVVEARGQSAFALNRSREWRPIGEALPWALQLPARSAPEADRPSDPAVLRSRRRRKIMSRYDTAYLAARTAVVVGVGLIVAGVLVAFIVFLNAAATVSPFPGLVVRPNYGAALFAACASGGTISLAGLVTCVLGHHLNAALDSVVQTSPFLDDEQRAEIMSL